MRQPRSINSATSSCLSQTSPCTGQAATLLLGHREPVDEPDCSLGRGLCWAGIAQAARNQTPRNQRHLPERERVSRAEQHKPVAHSRLAGHTQPVWSGVGRAKPLFSSCPISRELVKDCVGQRRSTCIHHGDKTQGWGELFVLGWRKFLGHITINPGTENNWIIKTYLDHYFIFYISHIILHIILSLFFHYFTFYCTFISYFGLSYLIVHFGLWWRKVHRYIFNIQSE